MQRQAREGSTSVTSAANERRAFLLLRDHYRWCGVWLGSEGLERRCGKRAMGAGEYRQVDDVLIGFCDRHQWAAYRFVYFKAVPR